MASNHKECSACGESKPLADFPKKGKTKSGKQIYRDKCRICHNIWRRERRDPAKEKEYAVRYRRNSPEKYQASVDRHKSRAKERYKRKAERNIALGLTVKGKPRKPKLTEEELKIRRSWRWKLFYEKNKHCPKYHLYKTVGRYIRDSVKRGMCLTEEERSKVALKHFSFDLKQLMEQLESRFTSGMSWGNYGEWHIDHVFPVSMFNFDSTNCQEFIECYSLSNLQPLWAKDNQRKGDKVIWLN